jgi:hypothetical protein
MQTTTSDGDAHHVQYPNPAPVTVQLPAFAELQQSKLTTHQSLLTVTLAAKKVPIPPTAIFALLF